jgi:membrane-bound lytic murein transglycosylase D
MPFPRPPEIEKAVDFWTRIYSEVDSNSGFIHDSRALDIIYEVYPLPVYVSPRKQHRIIQKRIRHFQQLLRKIAQKSDEKLSREERRVKRLWGAEVSPSQIRSAAKRVRFQRGQSDRMRLGLERAATYEKRIRRILRDKGIPEQLAALPHVESSYNPRVKSKAGAAGLWQIMPATGRRYLRVNNVMDERLDPYKATTAAAELLKHNYSVLKSWPLAITAYNHGLSGVRRAVRKTGTTNIETIIQKYNGRAFKFASRNFYPAFLAAYDVSTSQQGRFKEHEEVNVPIVALNAYMPAAAIIDGLGVDEQALKDHNPDLGETVWRGEKYIPKSYRLRIPIKRDAALLQIQVAALGIRAGHAKQVPDLLYRVQRGDNLSGIAQRHDTSVKTLMAMNNLRSRHRINIGQLLRIPQADEVPAAVYVAASLPADANVSQIEREAVPVVVAHVTEADPEFASENDDRGGDAKDQAPSMPSEVDEEVVGESETVVIKQSDLNADPADYLVAEDGTIEVQVGETLGHYAHWLKVPTRKLRALNGVRHGQHVIVGQRFRLVFSTEDTKAFESKRKKFHTRIQNRFFTNHHIVDVKDHPLADGDNLWELSTQTYRVPLWLLRQYNPDLAFDSVLSLSSSLRVPVVQLNDESVMSQPVTAPKSS